MLNKPISNKPMLWAIVFCFCWATNLPSYSWPVSLTVSSGEGDQATYKRGLLGNKRTCVEDRFGDKYESKRGIFGISKDEGASLLGNGGKYHKGIFGNTETGVHTMLGDTVKYKRNVFGWRSGKIDLHGTSALIDQAFNPGAPSQNAPLASPNYAPASGPAYATGDQGRALASPESHPLSSPPSGVVQEGFPLK